MEYRNMLVRGIVAVSSLFGIQPAFAADDNYAVKFNIGIVESWRVKPAGVIKWCRDADPSGAALRESSYRDWLAKNDELIQRINENVQVIVPLISPSKNPNVNVVEAVRAHIAIETDRVNFLGKDSNEVASFCKAYTIEPENAHVRRALLELEKWRAQTVR
jgi:hypothetical protein